MSYSRPMEEIFLAPIEARIQVALQSYVGPRKTRARLDLLGIISSKLGGYRPSCMGKWLEEAFEKEGLVSSASSVLPLIEKCHIPPALILAALARPELHGYQRNKHGVFYTDFRLAAHLAKGLRMSRRNRKVTLLDPACGSGMLLAAAALEFCRGSKKQIDAFLSESVCGADLSKDALRGAAISLASMTDNADVVRALLSRLRCQDSLLAGKDGWKEIGGFDAVIANPPWEKVRLTRHEFLRLRGVERHYGEGYKRADVTDFGASRMKLQNYAGGLRRAFELQGAGEIDLYKFFVELCLSLANPGGAVSLLVPAGLIRSLGTRELRESLIARCSNLEFDLFDNKSRFFQIDSRFKFMAIRGQILKKRTATPIKLAFGKATEGGVLPSKPIAISRADLVRVRPDLSLPEVRSSAEWRVFRQMTNYGALLGDPSSGWSTEIVREVDMTQDRDDFKKNALDGYMPLVEGRMVHQYALGVKKYVSGTGRRAVWETRGLHQALLPLRPQFYFPVEQLSSRIRNRISAKRIGFCDISGQTNERTMIAALIPANIVCGNKVPTVTFSQSRHADDQMFAWLAIANSIPFDWLLRRVVTTTINFFHLTSLAVPQWDSEDKNLMRIAEIGRRLSYPHQVDAWLRASLRAEADLRTLLLYGQGFETLKLMLNDFPLLDRAQPALEGEDRSTITRDYLFLRSAELMPGLSHSQLLTVRARVKNSRLAGAAPYIPSFLGGGTLDDKTDSARTAAHSPSSRDSSRGRQEAPSSV